MELEEKIFSALERIHTASRSALQRAVSDYGISPLQAQIIHFLHRRDSSNVSELAEQIRVSKPTVSDAVTVLLEKKLIKRTASQHDARSSVLKLTTKGKAQASHLASYAAPFLDSVGELNETQKASLWDALLHLLRTMESQRLIPHQQMCFSCKHFAKDTGNAAYYCRLMNKPLPTLELRIDCQEFERAVA